MRYSLLNLHKQVLFILIVLFIIFLPFFTSQAVQCTPGGNNSAEGGICNPVDASSLPALIFLVIKYFGYFAGAMTVVGMMVTGFMMIMAGGNSEKLDKAKSSFQWSLFGFIIVLFSFIIVSAVKTFMGVQDVPTTAYNEGGTYFPINPFGTGAEFKTLMDKMILGFTGVIGLIAVLMLIINGIKYMTAGANDEQATAAKTGIQWSVIGIMIILLAYVIVRALATFFGTVN